MNKSRGFAIAEVLIILGITTLVVLGMSELIRNLQKSSKQMKELNNFEILKGFISTQLKQASDPLECSKYFPTAENPSIQSATETKLTIMDEAEPPNQPRIRNDESTYINGNKHLLVLTTLDPICHTDPTKWCAGKLNLKVERRQGSSYFGQRFLSEGFVAREGFVANFEYQVNGAGGSLKSCRYVPSAYGGEIDFDTCDYHTVAGTNYTPVPGLVGVGGERVTCPLGYLSIAACRGSCFSGVSSALCCRLRDPAQVLSDQPPVTLAPRRGQWRSTTCQRANGEAVTGVCSGACTNSQFNECTKINGIGLIGGFCRPVDLGSTPNKHISCKYDEVLTGYCPGPGPCAPGTALSQGLSAGQIQCCPIIH